MFFEQLLGAPTTKYLAAASASLGLLQTLDVFTALDYFYSPTLIVKSGEIWRLVTSVLYGGPFNLGLVFNLMSFIQYAATIESRVFAGAPEDFILFLLFGSSVFYTFGRILCIPFLFPSLMGYCLYYWSRHFGDQEIQVMSLPFAIPVQYLPIAALFMTFQTTGYMGCVADILGYVAAHIFFFVRDVVSTQYNKPLLRAPHWLKQAVLPLKSQ
jgi:Derlin-2/3